MNFPEGVPYGTVALVCYVPGPLGSFLDQLLGQLPSNGQSQAHITLLPPRPLRVPLETASNQIRGVLRDFHAFEIELSSVERFEGSNILYLAIARGETVLQHLHDALNIGDLAYREEFEFMPHLTLTCPIPDQDLESWQRTAESEWNSATCPRSFTIDQVVFLGLYQANGRSRWDRLWEEQLTSPAPTTRRTS